MSEPLQMRQKNFVRQVRSCNRSKNRRKSHHFALTYELAESHWSAPFEDVSLTMSK